MVAVPSLFSVRFFIRVCVVLVVGIRFHPMLIYDSSSSLSTSFLHVIIFFVSGTQTMEWFLERGFDEVSVDRLPPSRQAMYNYKRKSKIYLKKIESARDLDASELWWNR
jgi:hypothetical protein